MEPEVSTNGLDKWPWEEQSGYDNVPPCKNDGPCERPKFGRKFVAISGCEREFAGHDSCFIDQLTAHQQAPHLSSPPPKSRWKQHPSRCRWRSGIPQRNSKGSRMNSKKLSLRLSELLMVFLAGPHPISARDRSPFHPFSLMPLSNLGGPQSDSTRLQFLQCLSSHLDAGRAPASFSQAIVFCCGVAVLLVCVLV